MHRIALTKAVRPAGVDGLLYWWTVCAGRKVVGKWRENLR